MSEEMVEYSIDSVMTEEQFEESKIVANHMMNVMKQYEGPLSMAQMLMATAMIAAGFIVSEDVPDAQIESMKGFYNTLVNTGVKVMRRNVVEETEQMH